MATCLKLLSCSACTVLVIRVFSVHFVYFRVVLVHFVNKACQSFNGPQSTFTQVQLNLINITYDGKSQEEINTFNLKPYSILNIL